MKGKWTASPRSGLSPHKMGYVRLILSIVSTLVVIKKISFRWNEINNNLLYDNDTSTNLLNENEENRNHSSSMFRRATDSCDQRVLTTNARRNWGEKFYSNRHLFEACKFNPIEKGGPTPTIFLVNGRSGSDVTWRAITTLAGEESPIGEHTGANIKTTKKFLGNMSEEEGAWWVTEHLCEFTRRHCNKPVVGFKWKPFVDSWNLSAAQGMLKKIASFNKPKIRVIYMTRNHLDVMISKRKHKDNRSKGVKAHCKPDEKDCIKIHASFGEGIDLPSNELVKTLQENADAVELFDSSLRDMGIIYMKTSYEKLYNSDDAEEWMRIFRFLGRGPTHDLTLDTVMRSLPYVKTSPKSHAEILVNFAEVQSVLNGTNFEHMLH